MHQYGRTTDAVNAVGFRLMPMRKTSNGRPAPDLDRFIITGRAIFDEVDTMPPIEVGNRDRRGNDFRTLVSEAAPTLSIDRRCFPTAIDETRQGDLVEVEGQERFEVVSVARDGMSRMAVRLA